MVAYIRCAVSCLLATFFATPLLAEPESLHKTAPVVYGDAAEGSDSLSLLQVSTGAKFALVADDQKLEKATTTATEAPECKDATRGDACWEEVHWAKTQGIYSHPEWYPTLTGSSSFREFQAALHKIMGQCPMPCPEKPSASAAQLSPAAPLPDLGGIIGNAVSGAVGAATGAATDALVKPLEDGLNTTLGQVEEKVDSVLAILTTKKEALIATAQTSWGEFTSQLNDTLGVALSQWDQIPWNAITGTLESVGASGLVPGSLTASLDTLTSFADTLSNSTAIAQILLEKQGIAYAEAEEKLGALNETLNKGLSMVSDAQATLKESFAKLLSDIPGMSDSMALVSQSSGPSDVLETLKTHVNTIADHANSAAAVVVSGVNQSIPLALGKLSGSFRSACTPAAAGLGSLLASLAAMAVATEGAL